MISRIIQLQSRLYWAGIVLMLISLFLLLLAPNDGQVENNGLFIINAAITGLYFFMLLLNKKEIPSGAKIFHWVIFFSLLLISAWALNKQMPVFEASVTWLSIMQVLVCASLVLAAFFRFLPVVVSHICLAIMGAGFILFVYMTLYLFPLYIFSVLAAIGLGISLHSFAPLLITIAIIVLANKLVRQRKNYLYSFLAGIGLSVLITIIFCMQWTGVVKAINKEYRNVIANENSDLPQWLQLAQRLPQNDITKKVLKTGIVYVQPNWDRLNLFWNTPSRNFDEPVKHDPLIVMASMFATPAISEEDRISILRTSFDSRHQTQERLWSGDNLSTTNVFTNALVWPSLQLAYLEKTITVKNNNLPNHWPRQEEAIYTFYLPEGSVVGSLSLWINGVEEKGVLTTKEKAEKAYKTIVGIESRDPSVVHWQEGNTVSVRVFPVLAGNTRVFKIGVTAPLIKKGDDVIFQNVYFKGPEYTDATETIRFRLNESAEALSVPGFFEKNNSLEYKYDGVYNNYWETRFAAKAIKSDVFSFQGKSYFLQRYQKQLESKIFERFYLDLNASWTVAEFNEVLSLLKDKNVYVNDSGIVKLTPSNTNELFEKLHQDSFSLFPLFDIPSPENSLLITKGSQFSPNISDLKHTPFADKLDKLSKSGKKVFVMDIGDVLPPYLKTLREYRALRYEKASPQQMKEVLTNQVFPVDQESDSVVVINDSELMISKSDENLKSTAPDHILRLFAYNNVMRQTSQTDSMKENTQIVNEAKQAHIVSPVSSLIVLETQEDYDRFDIHSDSKSLQNASNKKSGAVPEPHEWALIILFALLLLYLTYTSRIKRAA